MEDDERTKGRECRRWGGVEVGKRKWNRRRWGKGGGGGGEKKRE